MARRFDQIYRVKPRQNLGDPDFWNRRFEDIDRRINSTEDGLDEIGGLSAYVEGLALDRLNLVLAPAFAKISLISEQGFLLAHSISNVTLTTSATNTFAIENMAEREMFAPSPFVTITREANQTDYAFAKVVDWNNVSGQLVVQVLEKFGNPGPFTDWTIYVGSAISKAVESYLFTIISARDSALAYRDTASGYAATVLSDKNAVALMKGDTLAARDAAASSAAAAALFNPASYIAKTAAGTYDQTITFTMSPIVPTVTSTDNSAKAASTAFVKTAINALINGAGASLDTLNELAAALGNDANFSATITASLGNRLRVDTAAQGLNATQQSNARTNLGLANSATLAMATAAGIRQNVGVNPIGVDQAWVATAFVNLGAKTGSVVLDMSTGSRFWMQAVGNITISVVNQKDGQPLDIAIVQDAVGGRTVSWAAMFYFPDATVPTISTAANTWAVFYSGVFHPNGWFMGAGWKIN